MKPLVLLVDADPSELTALESVLANQGYGLARADSELAAKAMIGAATGDYVACLIDWELPDCSPTDLMNWIHEQQPPAIEVVLIAEELVRDNIQRGLDAGAYYFLTKPFEEEQLRAIMRATIATSELRRDLEEKIDEAGETLRLLRRGSFRFQRPRHAKLLAVQFGSACRDPQTGVALFELLLNAVEHGNLGIDYEEKGRLLAEQRLGDEIQRRLELSRYRDLWAQIDLERTDDGFQLMITDQGEGFDFARYLHFDKARLFDAHGRGILMANAALAIEYLAPGNRIRVRVPLSGSVTLSA